MWRSRQACRYTRPFAPPPPPTSEAEDWTRWTLQMPFSCLPFR
ncbi:MAG: hypothetical protein ACKESB_03480 [Candidatus Hodgkinia cicadicola]